MVEKQNQNDIYHYKKTLIMKKIWKTDGDFLNEMQEELDAQAFSGATPQYTIGNQLEMPTPKE